MDPNVKAFLDTIAYAEGTDGPDGYQMLFGGGLFHGFADHPRILVRRSGIASTAAGRYQILERTWDELGLPDFTPASQDAAAVKLLVRRKALDHIEAGQFDLAVAAACHEWASLPGAGYNQPERSLEKLESVYRQKGGT